MAYFITDLTSAGDDKTIIGILQNFGVKLQDDLRVSLQSKVKGFTSKKLEQSIQFQIDTVGDNIRFRLFMENYGDFINMGVKGIGGKDSHGNYYNNVAPKSIYAFKDKAPPVDELRQWAQVVGINPYAVSQSIYRKGLKPNYFYDEVVDENLINELIDKLQKVGAGEIEVELSNYINGTINKN